MKHKLLLFSTALLISLCSASTLARTPEFVIEINNHLFIPARLDVPANQKIKLVIYNRDNTAEEFESYSLNREKIIMGGHKAILFVGPLAPGEYSFFGEFNPKTAQGILVVKGK